MQITRKEFLGRLLQGAAGMVGSAIIAGCSNSSSRGGGDDDETSPDAAPPARDGGPAPDGAHAASCTANGTISAISANHGHLLTVTKADVAAGAARTYGIRGTADHSHSVTVTAAMFAGLKGNTAIMTASSSDSGHSHPVTVTCA
jgi:hypothetical protein